MFNVAQNTKVIAKPIDLWAVVEEENGYRFITGATTKWSASDVELAELENGFIGYEYVDGGMTVEEYNAL